MRKNDLPSRLATPERPRVAERVMHAAGGVSVETGRREPLGQLHGQPEHSSSLCLVDRCYR